MRSPFIPSEPSSADARNSIFTHGPALTTALLVRAGVNAAFVAWLVAIRPGWVDTFRGVSAYAIADGCLGLVTLLFLIRAAPPHAPPLIRTTTLIDALLRLTVGLALRALPGIPEFPVTAVLFYGVLATIAALLGGSSVLIWIAGQRHRRQKNWRWGGGTHALLDPPAITGVVALGFAAHALLHGPPTSATEVRTLGAIFTALLAIAFVAAAIGAAEDRANPDTTEQSR